MSLEQEATGVVGPEGSSRLGDISVDGILSNEGNPFGQPALQDAAASPPVKQEEGEKKKREKKEKKEKTTEQKNEQKQ